MAGLVFYKAPFRLPKGTTIQTEIAYDNSDTNIRNPTRRPSPSVGAAGPSTKWAA